MSSSPIFESGLLQQRLQEKKNSSKAAHQSTPDSASATAAGRDDGIFDFADSPRHAPRHSSARLFQSSPANPSIQRIAQSRRTSYMGPGSASSQRTMGVREMEDHIDKLSKQNFDLKLEVYHRREKIDELEKKVQELAQMRQDNEELVDINNDLILELDKRDRAVDEAVVMICDLEDRLRLSSIQLEEFRPRTARQHTSVPSIHRSVSHQTISTPARQRRRTNSLDNHHAPSRAAVSPEVSRQMMELATPHEQKHTRPLPTFLVQDSPSTRALSSLYVEGHKQIRAVPSRETLLSGTDVDSIMRSPAMSVLSESEFKSLYGGKNASPERPKAQPDSGRISPTFSTLQSDRTRFARTTKWVNERATSPTFHNPRPSRSSNPAQFQSLGGVLQVDPGSQMADDGGKQYPSHGRVAFPVAVFGKNNLPPTPDTMRTQQSEQSTVSLVHDQKAVDDTVRLPRRLRTEVATSIAGDLHAPNRELLPSRSILPPELHVYGSESDEDEVVAVERAGANRTMQQRDGHHSDESLIGRRAVTYHNPIMPSNLFEMNRSRKALLKSQQFPAHIPPTGPTFDLASVEMAPQPPIHRYRVSSAQQQPRPRPQSTYEALSTGIDLTELSSALDETPPPPPPHKDDAIVNANSSADERPSTSPDGASSKPEIEAAENTPSRADMIRQRVSKFGRRSAQTSQDSTPKANSNNPKHGRNSSFGRRTKQFFRRNSNTQNRPTTPRSPTSPQHRRRGTMDPDDEDDGGDVERRIAFMSAAQAAAPFLDLVGNQRKDAKLSVSTGIPLSNNPTRETRSPASSGSTSQVISPVDMTGKPIRSGGIKMFPRRGRDGEDVEPSN